MVYFPYTFIYPEQYEYMLKLKKALDMKVLNFSKNPVPQKNFILVDDSLKFIKFDLNEGSLCVRNAYRNWKNCVTSFSDHVIPSAI
jgi:hypothetical protein